MQTAKSMLARRSVTLTLRHDLLASTLTKRLGPCHWLVFRIVTVSLSRFLDDRHAHIADELDWTFIEADDGSLRIMGLSVEVEEILHPGDIFAIDFWRCTTFSSATASDRCRLVCGGWFGVRYSHVRALQAARWPEASKSTGCSPRVDPNKPKQRAAPRPCRSAFEQPGTWLFAEGCFQADFHKAFFDAVDGRAAGLHRCFNRLVADARVRCQFCIRLSRRTGCLPPLTDTRSLSRSIWLRSTRYRTFITTTLHNSGSLDERSTKLA